VLFASIDRRCQTDHVVDRLGSLLGLQCGLGGLPVALSCVTGAALSYTACRVAPVSATADSLAQITTNSVDDNARPPRCGVVWRGCTVRPWRPR